MKHLIRDRRFYRDAAVIALPILLQSLINISVNITDTFMLSRLGEAQISASSLAGQYCNLFQVMCFGISGGAMVMTAQYWGRRDTASIRRTMTLVQRLALALALLFTASAVCFPDAVMRVFTNEEPIAAEGARYFRFMGWSFLLQGLSVPLGGILRTLRKASVPFVASLCTFVANIFLNWVFIFGNLGAPRLEIEGAALGSLIAFGVEAAIIWGYVLLADRDIRYRWRDFFSPVGDILKEYFRFGLPVLISDTLLSFGITVLSVIMGHIGSGFVAAYAVVNMVMRLVNSFNQSLGQAGNVFVGNSLGAGRTGRAYDEAVSFFFLSTLMGVLGCGAILLVSGPFIRFYELSPDTAAIARQLMCSVALVCLFQAPENMLTKGVLRGGGDTRFLMVADALFMWAVCIPLGALAGLRLHWPPFWICLCLRGDSILKVLLLVPRLISKKWIRLVRSPGS